MNGPGRLENLDHLHDPGLLPLWRELHRKLSSGRPVRTVLLEGLDLRSQQALADLLGLSSYPGASVRVRLDRLDQALASSGLDTRAAVEALVAPIGDRAAERAKRAKDTDELWAWLAGHPVVTAEPALHAWADKVRADGAGGDHEAVRAMVDQALAIVAMLPLEDGLPLPALAQRATGDPHALDGTGRLPLLVLRALAALRDQPPPEDAEQRRALWAVFGVDCDAHSTNVLVLGLRPTADDPLSTTLRAWSAAGTAAIVTLDQLRSSPGPVVDARVIHVVENPSVLALAQRRFGPSCPPLVCVSGWPNSAAVALLRRLSSNGSELRYHGDFDGAGVRIAAYVMAKTGARPWRMATADYTVACAGPAPATRLSPGRITDAPWDPELAGAMREHAESVPEERVARLLLDDLAEAAAGRTEGRSRTQSHSLKTSAARSGGSQ
ncbi:TIGR02679 family protein [Nocardiopsis mangrovi]|uniref:TIGR02679 family protein n=1 Tax=Nocardiopsis mangrovi TaxID=1179818 RepID=A0ABV9DZU2_9ACTN